MAIQNRRGQSADFVASKMVPGEFAVSQDNRKLYLCFTAGNVKEIAIAEDMANAIAEMNLAMEEWHDEVVEDTEDKVEDAEAWAQGTRGGTPVPSTDPAYQHNAKYYAENIVDNTLSISGKAADAKKTGDEISDLKDDINRLTDKTKPNFELGNIDTQGRDIPSTNICRSDFVYVAKDIYADFSASAYYDLSCVLYNEDKEYVTRVGNVYKYENLDFCGYIRFTLRDNRLSTLTDEDISRLSGDFIISRNIVTDSIGVLKEDIRSVPFEIDNIKKDSVIYDLNLEKDYNLFKPDGYVLNSIIVPDGRIITNQSYQYVLSDFIEIDPSEEYICNYLSVINRERNNDGTYSTTSISPFERTNYAFFDVEKNVVESESESSAISKKIPSNAKYIRVTLGKVDYIPIARLIYGNFNTRPTVRIVDYKKTQKEVYYKPNTGFENLKMVMFGDSITHGDLGISDDGISYVDYINDYLGSNVLNCGFGGTRMSITGAGNTVPFAFCSLIDAIISNDWTSQDAYSAVNTTYVPHLEKLKAVDWYEIQAIGIMYGANDYMSNTPVGTDYNTDINNYDGACAYALNKLLTQYPHLQVILFTPFYRQPTGVDVIVDDTDNATNSAGLHMYDYGASLKNVQKIVHCPVIDTYYEFNLNRYNMKAYSWDGTHPRCNIANKRLGRLFAESIKRYIVPTN